MAGGPGPTPEAAVAAGPGGGDEPGSGSWMARKEGRCWRVLLQHGPRAAPGGPHGLPIGAQLLPLVGA